MKTVALITLGCAKNLVDSEVMLGYIEKNGYKLTVDLHKADIIIINTCGFIQPAREESRDSILEALAVKNKRKDVKVIVTGCYAERSLPELIKDFPDIDAWTGVKDFDKIISIIEEKPYSHSPECFLYDHTSPRIFSTPSSWTYLKISEGCSHRCAFCAIPLIKGPYRSRPVDSIIQEAEYLSDSGFKEINLISQDTTYYGRDLGLKDGLPYLLKQLLAVKNIGWIRILYGYPDEVNDDLLEIMQEDKICSYLDIPFQHSHPNIIKLMKRTMDGKKSLALIDKIRKKIPDISLRTSLIVGFPGEGDKEFSDLKGFVSEACFDHLGVFTYSQEAGTACYPMGDPIDEDTKITRRNKVLELQSKISFQINQKYIDQTIEILIEGRLARDPSLIQGRTPYQAPEVDGLVYIDAPQTPPQIINTFQKVEIIDRDIYDLYGELKS
ncbi:MAG: 30S ribosomal protein S12 methylthiotransferase RimO [Candidatus Aminicenantes bacterium]|nr:30S ribosomal protein S12 methylthiotransferase RimO [Candidatus Aminicenantes bacterium]